MKLKLNVKLKKIMKTVLVFIFLALFGLPLSALAQRETVPPPLRIGILPDADSIPFMLARDRGFFEREGVEVEIILFSNPQERDAAIQAGRLDGAVSDLLAAAFLISGGYDLRVTSLTNGRYGIVASPQSGITRLEELRGRRIGLSTNTIIQYTVDAQLAAIGISMEEYEAVAIPRMPLRMEMLLNGQIDAASLPEPLLTAAQAQGATLLSTTDSTGIEAGIMLFSRNALDNRLDDVRAFYRAAHRAALEINANPDNFRNYLVEQAGFPESIKDAYRFVLYSEPTMPEYSQIRFVIDWLTKLGLLSAAVAPEAMTDYRAIDGVIDY